MMIAVILLTAGLALIIWDRSRTPEQNRLFAEQ